MYRKSKILSSLLLVFFMLFVFTPINQASAYTIDDVVDEMQEIYEYMDDYDKDNIRAAQSALKDFAANGETNDWDLVIGDLLNQTVLDRIDADEDTARDMIKEVLISLGEVSYSTDKEELKATLENLKADNSHYKEEFRMLFGDDFTRDELYDVLQDVRDKLPNIITKQQAGILANATNEKLVEEMESIFKDTLAAVLELPDNQKFQGRLTAIGWSVDQLIDSYKEVSDIIDTDMKAQVSLAMAAIRSKTELEGGPITLQVGDKILAKDEYSITILGRGGKDSSQGSIANYVGWESAEDTVVKVSTGSGDNYEITALAEGTTQLIVYREYGNPLGFTENDWILKFDVTVEGDILYGDVNDDGIITSSDHQRLFEHLNGTNLLTGDALIASDVNKDGDTTSSDHQRLFEHLNGTNPLS